MKLSALQAEQKQLEPVVEQPEPSPGLPASSDAGVGIRISAVAKAFGERKVFSDLSLAIEPGAFAWAAPNAATQAVRAARAARRCRENPAPKSSRP